MGTHPSNEPANFTVKLSEPLNLEGDWEAALVSVQYTPNCRSFDKAIKMIVGYSSVNLPKYHYSGIYSAMSARRHRPASLGLNELLKQLECDTILSAAENAANQQSPNENIKVRLITIPPKYYSSVEALGLEICALVKSALHDETVQIRYEYDSALKRGQFVTSMCELLFVTEYSEVLGEILGHAQQKIDCICKGHDLRVVSPYGTSEPKLTKVHSLWLYSNIIQNQQVGDSKVPLLGIIPFQGLTTDRVHYTVNPVHFQALNRSHISEIAIQIVDDRGKRIPFVTGANEENLVCCLRLRRRKSFKPI
jgi:hypothetical protein